MISVLFLGEYSSVNICDLLSDRRYVVVGEEFTQKRLQSAAHTARNAQIEHDGEVNRRQGVVNDLQMNLKALPIGGTEFEKA